MSKGSPLMTSIERATSETLLRSDPVFNSSVKEIINSRPDMPKEAVLLFKKRIVARNPKIQILTLDLLDYLVSQLSLPFHTQIASKDFLLTLSQLYKSRDVDNQVKSRLKDLLTIWYRRFAESKDILPGFYDIYQQLKLGGEIERVPESQPSHFNVVGKDSPKKLPESKAEKLKTDLKVVRENINLANDMMRSRENLNNETLAELINTLRVMETKILSLVERLEDAEVLEICLLVKDDLQDCLQQYEKFKSNKLSQGIDLLLDSSMPNPKPPSENLIDSFDSLFISGTNPVNSGFATNPSSFNPNYPVPSNSNFYTQPTPVSLNNSYIPQSNLSFQGNPPGPDLLGFSAGSDSFFTGSVPNTVKPVENPMPSPGLYNTPANTGFGYNQPNTLYTGLNPAPNYNTGLNDLIIPSGNSGTPVIPPTSMQAKNNFNYKASEQFEDPFKSSINLNPVRKEQAKPSHDKKEQNFDDLFDFKF